MYTLGTCDFWVYQPGVAAAGWCLPVLCWFYWGHRPVLMWAAECFTTIKRNKTDENRSSITMCHWPHSYYTNKPRSNICLGIRTVELGKVGEVEEVCHASYTELLLHSSGVVPLAHIDFRVCSDSSGVFFFFFNFAPSSNYFAIRVCTCVWLLTYCQTQWMSFLPCDEHRQEKPVETWGEHFAAASAQCALSLELPYL